MTNLSVSFDPVKYRRGEIADFASKGLVEIPEHDNSEKVKFLNLHDNQIQEIDGDAIAGYSNLECLDISGNKIRKLNGLNACSGLILIDVSQNSLRSIAPIVSLTNLKSLNASRNRLAKIEFANPLPNLSILDISGNKIRGLSFLTALPNLKSLNIDYCEIETLDEVPLPKTLKVLSCEGNHLETIPSLPVSKLNLKRNRLKSLEWIIECRSLTEVDLSQNPIEGDHAVPETPNSALQILILSETRIFSCHWISQIFPNLETVDLSRTLLGNMNDLLEFIRSLKNLRVLDVRFTPLTNGLYDADGVVPSIEQYNKMYPENQSERMKFRRTVLHEGCNLRRLDMIEISSEDGSGSATETTIQSDKFSDIESKELCQETHFSEMEEDEEEDEEEDQETKIQKVSCADIIAEVLRDDGVVESDRNDLVDKDVQVQIRGVVKKSKMTKEEKQAVIQKLRQENMKMRADIDRIRAKLVNEKERQIRVDVEASDENYADDEDNAPELLSKENVPNHVESDAGGRDRAQMIDILERAMRENHFLRQAVKKRGLSGGRAGREVEVVHRSKSKEVGLSRKRRTQSVGEDLQIVREENKTQNKEESASVKEEDVEETRKSESKVERETEQKDHTKKVQRREHSRQGEVSKHSRQEEVSRHSKQEEFSKHSRQEEVSKHSRQEEVSKNLRHGEVSKHSRQGEVSKHSRQEEVSKHSRQGEVSKHSRHGAVSKQTKSKRTHRVAQEKPKRSENETDLSDSSFLDLDRDDIGKRILMAQRSPIQPEGVPVETDEYKYIMHWITTGIGFHTKNAVLERNSNSNFLAFERRATHVILAMCPCESPDTPFDLTSEVYPRLYKKLKKFMIGSNHMILVCAVDLGAKPKNLTSLSPVSNADLRQLQSEGYTSVIFETNGVETIHVLDASQVLPLFAESFDV